MALCAVCWHFLMWVHQNTFSCEYIRTRSHVSTSECKGPYRTEHINKRTHYSDPPPPKKGRVCIKVYTHTHTHTHTHTCTERERDLGEQLELPEKGGGVYRYTLTHTHTHTHTHTQTLTHMQTWMSSWSCPKRGALTASDLLCSSAFSRLFTYMYI
jgi:hypothetical protein